MNASLQRQLSEISRLASAARIVATLVTFAASTAFAQAPSPGAPSPTAPVAATPPVAAAPEAPASPLNGIRNKLSAADLLSAESILEVYGLRSGEDGAYLVGLSWLARGALLMGDAEKAFDYARQVRSRCADSLARGVALDRSHDVEIALGAAIEVEAQLLARREGTPAATKFVHDELARLGGPPAFMSRLHKRLNMLSFAGTAAPELTVEDFVGEAPPSLASLRGKPVVIFEWREDCGDCKAQELALAKVMAKHAGSGLQWVALTRYYDNGTARSAEKARVDSVWKSVYADCGSVPIVLSTASMIAYGASSTPTFTFIDRDGIVRGYTPTRLTEAELEKAVAPLLR